MKVNESNRPEFIAIVITIIFWIFFVFWGYSLSNPPKPPKYVGTHGGRWEGYLLNQYNQGSATFTVKESGNAKLVLRGKFSATHKGKIKNKKFITDKNQSCSIVDQGSGFKIVLIWTGVNVDVTF